MCLCMQEASQSAIPAASGWGADFLKQNAAAQASQSAAIAKEIAEKHAPAIPILAGAVHSNENNEMGTGGKSEPVSSSWKSPCCMAVTSLSSKG